MDTGDLQNCAMPYGSLQIHHERPFKAWVLGSSPSELTKKIKKLSE
jgi:hypothetical protein